jgi:hypothetical protein
MIFAFALLNENDQRSPGALAQDALFMCAPATNVTELLKLLTVMLVMTPVLVPACELGKSPKRRIRALIKRITLILFNMTFSLSEALRHSE